MANYCRVVTKSLRGTNRFLIDPWHYLSSRSDFGFEFAEIFVIEKRLPDSPSRGSRWLSDSASRQLPDSPSRRIGFWMFKRKIGESGSRRLPDSLSRESLWWVGESLFEFKKKFHHFKQLDQPFKGPIKQKISLGCNVLSTLIYLKVLKKFYL